MLCTVETAGMMADTSPEWKRPADVMKLRRRKTLCTNLDTTRTAALHNARQSLDACLPARKAQKRKNPFACVSSSTKTKDTKDNDEDTEVGDSSGVVEVDAEAGTASNCFIDMLVRCFIVAQKHSYCTVVLSCNHFCFCSVSGCLFL